MAAPADSSAPLRVHTRLVSAEAYAARAAKHDARTYSLNQWVSDVMGYANPAANFFQAIRDGTVLCRLLNRIKAGSVNDSQIIQNPANQDQCYHNLQLFVNSCINVGVPKIYIVMTPQSLSEDVVSSASHLSADVRMKRQKRVIQTLYAVAEHSRYFKFTTIACRAPPNLSSKDWDELFKSLDIVFEIKEAPVTDKHQQLIPRRSSLSSAGSDVDEEQESAKSTAKSVKKKPPHVSAPYDGYANDNIKALRDKKQRKQAAGLKGN